MRKVERGTMSIDYTGARRAAASLLALAAVSAAAAAAPVTYRVDPARTVAGYAIVYFGVLAQQGRFARSRGTMTIDLAAGEGSVEISIDARSVDSGFAPRDDFIRDGAMLDAARHPNIVFASTHLTFEAARLVRIEGRLSMHGVTRDVALDVVAFDCGSADSEAPRACLADATTALRRSDYGITGFVPLIDDVVTLDFRVVGVR